MSNNEEPLFGMVFLAVYELAKTDRFAQAALERYCHTQRMSEYVESIIKNPNQTQIAQRIYAHAIADRLEGK